MKFIVKSADWKDEHSVDDLVEGIMREAVVHSLKKRKKAAPSKVSVITECSVVRMGKKTTLLFNTYYMLVLAGMNKEAQRLRKTFLERFKIDLRNEKRHEKFA